MKNSKLNQISLISLGILFAFGAVDSKVIAVQGQHELSPLYRTESGFSREIQQFVLEVIQDRMPEVSAHSAKLIAKQVLDSSVETDLDPILILAVIQHESRFKSKIVGDAGEIGLMQIKPSTASWIAKKKGIQADFSGRRKNKLFDPRTNIAFGSAYLAHMKERFPKHNSLFLSAYNMGPSKVLKNLAQQRLPHQYSSKVLTQYYSIYRTLKEKLQNRVYASI